LKLLRQKSENLNIEFHINPDFNTLTKLYSQSAIYWHAAGFEVNEHSHPQNTEHFGIVVVEAMASGCVPIVVNAGGLPEIVVHGTNGYLWKSVSEASDLTYNLISSPELLEQLRSNALSSCQKFSKQNFYKSFGRLIK